MEGSPAPSSPADAAPARPLQRAVRLIDRYERHLAIGVGFVALLWFLWPVTRTAYLGDDAFIAFDPDSVAQQGRSIIDYATKQNESALDGLGRFSPLPTYLVAGAYYVAPSAFAYKAGVLLLVLLVAALAAVLMRQLGLPWQFAALVPVLLCATIQLRYWHDPMLAYSGTMQGLAALVLGSYVTFAASRHRGSRWLLALSVVLFVAALLWYEGVALYAAGFVPVAWAIGRPRLKAVVIAVLPFAALAFASIALLFVLRAGVDQQATGTAYQPSLTPGAVADGVAKQVSGAVPLSYLAVVARTPSDGPSFRPEDVALAYGAAQIGQDVPRGFVPDVPAMVRDSLRHPRGLSVLLLVAAAAALALRAARRTRPSPRAALAAAGVGLVMIFAPAGALAASARWQKETFPGVPYIGVFQEYIGMAMLLAAGLALLVSALAGRPRAITAVLAVTGVAVVVAAVATNALNQRVVLAFGGVEAGVNLAGDALQAGALGPAGGLHEVLYSEDVPLVAGFLITESGINVPAATELASFDGKLTACHDQGALCPDAGRRRAFVAHMDPAGRPWAAGCDVDLQLSVASRSAACTGTVTAVVGGERDPGVRCSDVVLDGAPAGARAPDAGLPVPLREVGRRGDVTLCEGATPPTGLLARSLLVSHDRPAAAGPLQILGLYPTAAVAGVRFNDQGTAGAIGVSGLGITANTRVVFDGVQLASQYLGPNDMSAIVPDELIAQPRTVQVVLRDGETRSAPFPLPITPAAP